MLGLSLTQPWATLVATGAKTIETRSWSTAHRGLIAIQAAKGFPADCRALCWRTPFAQALIEAGFDRAEQLPRGAIVAVAHLLHVAPIEHFVHGRLPHALVAREFAFGDFTPGRFGWVLGDIRRLREPIPCKGALGLWKVPADVAMVIAAELGRAA